MFRFETGKMNTYENPIHISNMDGFLAYLNNR